MMDISELKKRLQEHLTDGLCTIVGSGISAAAGLPTMRQLTAHLLEVIPTSIPSTKLSEWEKIANALGEGADLEGALSDVDLDPVVEGFVIQATATLLTSRERDVVSGVLSAGINLPFGMVLKHLFLTANSLPVITTNYDRLIEFSAETAEFGVNSLFSGQTLGILDPKRSKEALGHAATSRTGRNIRRIYRRHVRLFKPHGSLDWYEYNGAPVRCSIQTDLLPLMITPGKNKYLKGYDRPFDLHREAANHEIDRAARFLILGYGFNDQQLETHLRPQLNRGKPCVILVRSLTGNAREVIAESPSTIALSKHLENDSLGTLLTTSSGTTFYSGVSLWDLQAFVEEVLAP